MSRKVLVSSFCLALLGVAPLAAQQTVNTVEGTTPVEGEIVGEVVVTPVEGYIESYPGESYPVQGTVAGAFETVSFNATPGPIANGALAIVNSKRRRAGLHALMFDPGLTSVAQQKSNIRANRRLTGHDGSYKGGAAVEGVGHAYGSGDLHSRFNTCYLYSTGYRTAGAAVAFDGGGRAYYTLLLR